MSDYNDPFALGAVPTARRLDSETDEHPKGWFGTLSQFPRATPKRIEAVRKNVTEIPDERLDRSEEVCGYSRRARSTNSCASTSTSSTRRRQVRLPSRSPMGTSSACARRVRGRGLKRPRREPAWGSTMKPPPGWEREMARIASRPDRHLVGRDMWTERDWRVQRQEDAGRRARKAKLIADMERPLVVPATLTVASFSLFDRTAAQERQRRLAANRALEKAGVRPRPWS